MFLYIIGDVFYTGAGEGLGESQNSHLPQLLPSFLSKKVERIAVAPDGKHGLFVLQGGTVYSSGANESGEAGQEVYSKSSSMRPIGCMEGNVVTHVSCGISKSLLITQGLLTIT